MDPAPREGIDPAVGSKGVCVCVCWRGQNDQMGSSGPLATWMEWEGEQEKEKRGSGL